MDGSMMDSVLGMVTPEIREALAARLGEPASAVQTGLTGAAAAILGALAGHAGESGFLSQILALVSGSGTQNVLGNLTRVASGAADSRTGDLIGRFLPTVFGSNQGQVASAISQQAGLTAGSGSGLLKMAVPLVLGYLGRLHDSGSLDAATLGGMLRAEAPNLQSYLPAGLSALVSPAGVAPGALTATESQLGTEAAGGSRWLAPLAILGVLVLAWLLLRSMAGPQETARTAGNATSQAASTAVNAVNSAANSWAALGDMTKVKLPDGSEIDVPAKGIEVRLVQWLNDPSTQVTQATWFEFDRLLFDTGKATLQPASQEQLGNIAAILRAYPGVRITIGGYTDNTGDAEQNVKLSENRADNVMAALTMLGVDPGRMEAQGYGEKNPIANNSTEEGRQKNRRISLRVTDKPAERT